MSIVIETHQNIQVLRDDLLPGGTKSILLKEILDPSYTEYVYASPVYGAAQIALSSYCKSIGKQATIFCAKRTKLHPNTQRCLDLGAKVVEIPYGYLYSVQHHAKNYCEENGAMLLPFGLDTEKSKTLLANRTKDIISQLGYEPDEVWCALGSGVLMEGIIKGTTTSKIKAVQVGKEYNIGIKQFQEGFDRLEIYKHKLAFDKISKFKANFPSTPNYDLKAWEMCVQNRGNGKILFWNVF
jgi:hypothetical protein